MVKYYVYMLYCGDKSIYTGYTNDLVKRYQTHAAGKGAKYTQSHLPVYLIYSEEFNNKSSAMKREYAIKQLSHEDKVKLAKSKLNDYMQTTYGDRTVDMTADELYIMKNRNHGVNGIQYRKESPKINITRCQAPSCPFGHTYVDDLNDTTQNKVIKVI